jgi:hypothetical protein
MTIRLLAVQSDKYAVWDTQARVYDNAADLDRPPIRRQGSHLGPIQQWIGPSLGQNHAYVCQCQSLWHRKAYLALVVGGLPAGGIANCVIKIRAMLAKVGAAVIAPQGDVVGLSNLTKATN